MPARTLCWPVVLIMLATGCSDRTADTARAPESSAAAEHEANGLTEGAPAEPTSPIHQPKNAELTRSNVGGPEPVESVELRNPSELALVPFECLDGKVSLEIPETFRPMTERELEIKYRGGTRPDVALTGTSTAINLTATHTMIPLLPGQIYEYHKSFEMQIKAHNPDGRWISNEQVTVDDRDCWLSQFRKQLSDAEVHNMVLGTSVNNRVLLLTFTMPASQVDAWSPVARKILLAAKFTGVTMPDERGDSAGETAASEQESGESDAAPPADPGDN